jgi:hypothetical protein
MKRLSNNIERRLFVQLHEEDVAYSLTLDEIQRFDAKC